MNKCVTILIPLFLAVTFLTGCQKTPDEKISEKAGYDREKDIERANKIREGGRNAFDRAADQDSNRRPGNKTSPN